MRYSLQSTGSFTNCRFNYRQTDFTPKRAIVSRLDDSVARLSTGVKFSPWYNNWGELTPGWLAPAWHFVVVSCKQMLSHERELEWTRAGLKVAPVSCKHPALITWSFPLLISLIIFRAYSLSAKFCYLGFKFLCFGTHLNAWIFSQCVVWKLNLKKHHLHHKLPNGSIT